MISQQIIDRGMTAQQIVESAVFREACEAVRRDLIRQWTSTPHGEDDYALKSMIHALAAVESKLAKYMQDGAYETKKRG